MLESRVSPAVVAGIVVGKFDVDDPRSGPTDT